jgi:Protein of unknown function (DUF3592)
MEPAALIVGIVTAVSLVVLVALVRRSRRADAALRARSREAEGEVLDVWQDGMGSFCVRYRFTPQGSAAPITRDEFAGCLKATLPEVGDRLLVRYDPDSPQRAALQRRGC